MLDLSRIPGLRGGLGSRVLLAGVAMVAAQVAYRAWALAGSWFYFDDIAFMSRAMDQPFGVAYLTESYGGHLMPGGFALAWVLTEWAAYDWWPWALTLLAMTAVAGLGMLRLLVSMFGRRPVVLVLLAGYLGYVFTVPAGLWWAAGINQLPLQIALVFGLHAHLHHLRTGRLRPLLATLGWTALGLVFYEKTLLLFGIYALVTLGYFSVGRTPERLRTVWRDYRLAVISYAVAGAAYLALYIRFGLDFSPGESNNQPWSPIAGHLIGEALSSALIGGPFTWEPIAVGSFADPSQLVQLMSWVFLGGVLAYAYRTRTISVRAWSLIGFTLLSNVVLLASARANIVGPDIAREYRYQTESGALFVICAGLAFLPLLGAREVNAERVGVPRTYERGPLVLAATVAIALGALVSSTRYVVLWQEGNPSKAYFSEVHTTLAAAPDQPVPLVDTGIPQTLLWAFRYPENAYSHVFRNLSARTTYPATSVDRLFMFSETGALTPAAVPTTRAMIPDAGCGYRLAARGTTIPLDGPVIGGGWWVQAGYDSPRAVTVEITAGTERHVVDLPQGRHDVFFKAEGEFSEIRLAYQDTSSRGLCVTDLVLGLPEPAARS